MVLQFYYNGNSCAFIVTANINDKNIQESPAEARVTRDSSACIKTPDK